MKEKREGKIASGPEKKLDICPRSELGKEMLDIYEILTQLGFSEEKVKLLVLERVCSVCDFFNRLEAFLQLEGKRDSKTTGESNGDRH